MSDENQKLSPMERAFCRAYVANGGNGTQAAIAAGYSEKGASVAAARLLKRPAVIAEIERLRLASGKVVEQIMSKALAAPGDGYVTRAAKAEAEADRAAVLNRAWVIAGVIENFEIALGRRSATVTKLLTRKAAKVLIEGQAPVIVEELVAEKAEVFQRDAAAANRAAEILLEEVARLEAAGQGGEQDDTGRHPLAERLDRFMRST